MIEVTKMKSEHFEQLLAQEWNASMRPYFTQANIAALERHEHSYSVITETGRVIFCGGVALYWVGRCEVWGVFDPKCRKEFIAIHNAVKKFLKSLPIRRIEASVQVGFESGHRWIKALGFTMEAPLMRAFTPDGADCSMYALVREAA